MATIHLNLEGFKRRVANPDTINLLSTENNRARTGKEILP